MAEGREDLKGSKHDRLYDQANRMPEKRRNFRWLRESASKTARASAIENWPCRYGVMQELGAQGLETAAVVGHALSSRTDKEGRQDNKETSVGYFDAIVLKIGNGLAEGIAASRRLKSKAGDSVTNSVLPMPSTFRWVDLYPASLGR
uniref:Uncharacterized protein n=1 Tax=Candidatus Kentrum sp. TC TaxID=2126339 RepID=A0A450YEV3_9GAMM|nr:MAG: hypothetical protein BECKTC1821E_GA0114239_100659 [Candidatus Kentron sp. TC]